VTDQAAPDQDPTWLPDGRLTFVSEQDQGYGIYEAYGDGRPHSLVLRLVEGEYDPAFSPAGNEVAVLAASGQGYAVRIYSLVDGTSQTLSTGTGVASEVSWSPDGSQLLFTVFGETDARLRTVTRTGLEADAIPTLVNAAYGVWTPRANEIVFASNADGDWDLYILQLTSGLVQSVTRNGYPDLYPMVSR